jgi:hypothetical protein
MSASIDLLLILLRTSESERVSMGILRSISDLIYSLTGVLVTSE